jgi:hypothetical protein
MYLERGGAFVSKITSVRKSIGTKIRRIKKPLLVVVLPCSSL